MEQPLSTLGLPNYKLQQLLRLGYHYLKDLNPSDEKVQAIFQNDLEVLENAPQTKSALDLYQEETTQGSIITFIKNLDEILGGGVRLKQITEFCGEAGSGKSQISYLLCINVQFPYWCGGAAGEAIYISTKYGFNPERLREMAVKSAQIYENLKSSSVKLNEFSSYFKIENIMKKIHFIHVVTDVEFISTVNVLENWLQMNKNIKLIIVDSITAPIRFAAIEKRAEILNNVIYNLKVLANRYNLAVSPKSESPQVISDEELVLIPVKDLNKLLKMKRYSKAEINSMKQKRRTLKNRGYAASCRIKKIEQKDELEVKKTAEWSEMEEMQDETRNFKKECDSISVQYEALKKFALHHKISIPPELDVL